MIGAYNTLNSIYKVAGSLAASILLKTTGVDESTVLGLVGALNLAAAAYFWRRLAKD